MMTPDSIRFSLLGVGWRLLMLGWYLAWLPQLLYGQVGHEGLRDRSQWKLTVDGPKEPKIGDVITLHFDTPIEPHYHIYSVKPYPADKPGPTPTQFSLDPEAKGIQLAGPLRETGKLETYFDDIFGLEVYQFSNKVRFSQSVKITGQPAHVVGVLKYQICNDDGCLYGQFEVDFTPTLASSNSLASAESAEPDPDSLSSSTSTAQTTPANTQPSTNNPSEAAASIPPPANQGDLWWTFLKAFLGGLASLITPCVFPMIPMTVSYFTKRSGTRAKGIRNAFLYSGSIVSIFVVLGLVITITFGVETIYNLSTNPWMNLVLFAIVFIFGLSFLGLFELSLPSSWVTSMDKQSDRGGLIGIFFMALTLVLASFSCVGPIAGIILIDASKGAIGGPLVGMLGYSLGFALPFGLFALFPQALQSLPKSGGWLNSVKVVLGFLELALALKFLSNADLYNSWGLLDREVFLSLWIVIFTLLGFYLLGKIRLPHDSALEKIPVPRLLLAIASLTFVVYLIPGLWGAPLAQLAGLLPPPNNQIGVRIAPVFADQYFASAGQQSSNDNPICQLPRKHADKLAEKAPDGYCMFYDLEEAQAYARQVNKPLFLDFTGHTCANCREMEHKVWPNPEVKKELTENYVMVSLYVDEKTPLPETIRLPDGKKLRTVGDRWQHFQINRYNIFAQPYYMLTDAELNALVPQGVGYTPDVSEYLAFLRLGVQHFNRQQASVKP